MATFLASMTPVVAFIVIWWLVFFMVLPLGVQRDDEPEDGKDPGAPKRPHIVRKLVITTGIAVVLFGVYLAILHFDLITLRPPDA